MLILIKGYTFYTENAGLPSLREVIADKYNELHQVDLNPHNEMVVTASGVQALNVCIRCVIDPGDEAIVLTPNWPNASAIFYSSSYAGPAQRHHHQPRLFDRLLLSNRMPGTRRRRQYFRE